MAALKAQHEKEAAGQASPQSLQRNKRLAKEVYLSLSRCPARQRGKLEGRLMDALREAKRQGARTLAVVNVVGSTIARAVQRRV